LSEKQETHERFRPEIAGLRAVAVAGVILFHLKVAGFQGGYVGVDVFLVISGYLITRNVLGDITSGQFSFANFYTKRTRRIYPALIFTVLATYLCGLLWCSPPLLSDLAKEATHAILSISNIQYWRESQNYFAQKSENLVLLHCWSLSLEEQFYLIWPALLLVAAKLGRTFEIIAAAGAASLACSMIVSQTDPSAAFFLTPFRMFEFVVGAMVLLAESKSLRVAISSELMFAIGILSILVSAVLFRSEMPHADVASLLPCVGAALVIRAGSKHRLAAILTNRTALVLGALSYSLYLCHWPIIFFGRFIFGNSDNSPLSLATMIAAMFAVAGAMNRLIEQRFLAARIRSRAGFKANIIGFSSVVLAIAALTHTTFLEKGFAWRLPEAEDELARLQSFPTVLDVATNNGPVGFDLVGDSFAVQYLAGLAPLMRELGIKADLQTLPGCPLLVGAKITGRGQSDCQAWHDQTLASLRTSDLPVVLAQRWDAYLDDKTYLFETPDQAATSLDRLKVALETTLQDLVLNKRRILIIGDQVRADCPIDRPRILPGPLPHAPATPCTLLSRKTVERSSALIDRMLESVRARWPENITLLSPVKYFCDAVCPVVKDNLWLYFDDVHFSVAGSRYMVDRSRDVFLEFLGGKPCIPGQAIPNDVPGSTQRSTIDPASPRCK
jgi:peptidoglycan/LPS O-acetylase OafA/YrhL